MSRNELTSVLTSIFNEQNSCNHCQRNLIKTIHLLTTNSLFIATWLINMIYQLYQHSYLSLINISIISTFLPVPHKSYCLLNNLCSLLLVCVFFVLSLCLCTSACNSVFVFFPLFIFSTTRLCLFSKVCFLILCALFIEQRELLNSTTKPL